MLQIIIEKHFCKLITRDDYKCYLEKFSKIDDSFLFQFLLHEKNSSLIDYYSP